MHSGLLNDLIFKGVPMSYFETNPTSLVAADFDYFRIPRPRWALMLTRLKQMGVNSVFLSVPWGFHEIERGVIDLSGATDARRDLLGLLAICTTMDLRCLLHLGPYNNSGLLAEGLPMWLLKTDHAGDALVEATKHWYKAASAALIEQQWPNGPIVALKLDSKEDDGQTRTLSQDLTEVKWPIWLRKHYQGIEALNAAYGTDYRTVSQVQFPETWANESTRLEQDAQAFLEETQTATQTGYVELLAELGWNLPIYPSATETPAGQPAWQTYLLTDPAGFELPPGDSPTIFHLQQPIQVDPDPPELGVGTVWAEHAPIRPDGSVRRSFWTFRQALWMQQIPDSRIEEEQLIIEAAPGLMVTSPGDTTLKIETTVDTKTPVFRLRFNGEVMAADTLKIARKKLSGPYVAEDAISQTDWGWAVEPTAPLSGVMLAYLRTLLNGQVLALTYAATVAESLSQSLALDPRDHPPTKAPSQPAPAGSYILSEARRGLREADAALKKALASIGELEGGFSTMLRKDAPPVVQPAPQSVAVNPQAFQGKPRDMLLGIGASCHQVARLLSSTIQHLRETSTDDLTLADYQQLYAEMIPSLQSTQTLLLKHLALLRLELASEELPLVLWRVHDQVQAIAEGLRWGVVTDG